MARHALRSGEHLAVHPDAIQRDENGFFFLLGPSAPDNDRHGTVGVVHIRGALSHYETPEGDSYESIVKRVSAALSEAPSAVVLRIESPGGVVAGLNETVRTLQRMSKEAKVPLVAYVDEMAASAAYALACSCGEILAPPSAVVGSVGVISTMASQVRKDRAEGYDFVLITSGARKADGHVHAPISDDAVAEETRRNGELAAQFFALAGKARGMKPKALAKLEAAIYLATDAKAVGLIDDVASFDEVLFGLGVRETDKPSAVAPNQGNETDRRADPEQALALPGTDVSTCANPPHEDEMAVKLDALIARTEAAIATETDAKKKTRLVADLAIYSATKTRMESGGDDDGDEDDDGDDESKAKMAAKKAEEAKRKAEASKHKAKAAEHRQKAAESEEAAKKCMDGDEEESEEEAAAAPGLSPGATAALESQAKMVPATVARIEALEKDAEERNRRAMVAEALTARRITPGEATSLAKKDSKFVRDFLEMRPHAIVNTDASALAVPDGTPNADLGADVLKSIDMAVTSANLVGDAANKMRDALVKAHRDRRATLNGAQERS